jgi:hypothetical protein
VSDSGSEPPGGPAPEERFPRAKNLPTQSPLFWVQQKDRYLRQLLIRDIESITNRRLIAYFANGMAGALIDGTDPRYIVELLEDANGQPVGAGAKIPQ